MIGCGVFCFVDKMTRLTTPEIIELQNLCRRSLPERLDQHVSQFALDEDGRHRTLSFVLTWSESRCPRVERLQVRGYLDEWTMWAAHDAAKAQRDWQVMSWLYTAGLQVPCVYAAGEDYVLMERSIGHSVGLSDDGWRGLVTPRIDTFASLLAQLHRQQPPERVRQVLHVIEIDAELSRLGEIARQCLDIGLEEAMAEFKVWLGAQERKVAPPCVLCGEAILAHAQIDARGVTLPCWQDAALGDARWDVARTVAWLRARHADDLAARFLDAYRARAIVDDLDVWNALVGVQNWALADWMHARQPGHPRAAERSTWIELTWRTLARLKSQNQQMG